jgi:hypothetical protein
MRDQKDDVALTQALIDSLRDRNAAVFVGSAVLDGAPKIEISSGTQVLHLVSMTHGRMGEAVKLLREQNATESFCSNILQAIKLLEEDPPLPKA